MSPIVKMPPGLFDELTAHLLPPDSFREEAAFLFVTQHEGADNVAFEVIEAEKLAPAEFESRFGDYLELADETRARLIKHAHHLGASLVEMHSHPGPYAAAFSLADRMGLQETVPHMWWRLKQRPYLAIVVAATGFDALVWLDNPKVPQALGGILAGDRLLRPTNRSLEGWQ